MLHWVKEMAAQLGVPHDGEARHVACGAGCTSDIRIYPDGFGWGPGAQVEGGQWSCCRHKRPWALRMRP